MVTGNSKGLRRKVSSTMHEVASKIAEGGLAIEEAYSMFSPNSVKPGDIETWVERLAELGPDRFREWAASEGGAGGPRKHGSGKKRSIFDEAAEPLEERRKERESKRTRLQNELSNIDSEINEIDEALKRLRPAA